MASLATTGLRCMRAVWPAVARALLSCLGLAAGATLLWTISAATGTSTGSTGPTHAGGTTGAVRLVDYSSPLATRGGHPTPLSDGTGSTGTDSEGTDGTGTVLPWHVGGASAPAPAKTTSAPVYPTPSGKAPASLITKPSASTAASGAKKSAPASPSAKTGAAPVYPTPSGKAPASLITEPATAVSPNPSSTRSPVTTPGAVHTALGDQVAATRGADQLAAARKAAPYVFVHDPTGAALAVQQQDQLVATARSAAAKLSPSARQLITTATGAVRPAQQRALAQLATQTGEQPRVSVNPHNPANGQCGTADLISECVGHVGTTTRGATVRSMGLAGVSGADIDVRVGEDRVDGACSTGQVCAIIASAPGARVVTQGTPASTSRDRGGGGAGPAKTWQHVPTASAVVGPTGGGSSVVSASARPTGTSATATANSASGALTARSGSTCTDRSGACASDVSASVAGGRSSASAACQTRGGRCSRSSEATATARVPGGTLLAQAQCAGGSGACLTGASVPTRQTPGQLHGSAGCASYGSGHCDYAVTAAISANTDGNRAHAAKQCSGTGDGDCAIAVSALAGPDPDAYQGLGAGVAYASVACQGSAGSCARPGSLSTYASDGSDSWARCQGSGGHCAAQATYGQAEATGSAGTSTSVAGWWQETLSGAEGFVHDPYQEAMQQAGTMQQQWVSAYNRALVDVGNLFGPHTGNALLALDNNPNLSSSPALNNTLLRINMGRSIVGFAAGVSALPVTLPTIAVQEIANDVGEINTVQDRVLSSALRGSPVTLPEPTRTPGESWWQYESQLHPLVGNLLINPIAADVSQVTGHRNAERDWYTNPIGSAMNWVGPAAVVFAPVAGAASAGADAASAGAADATALGDAASATADTASTATERASASLFARDLYDQAGDLTDGTRWNDELQRWQAVARDDRRPGAGQRTAPGGDPATPAKASGGSGAGSEDFAPGTDRGPFVDLYHGTGGADIARNIIKNGIDPSFLNPYADFGRGFYTTKYTDIAEARGDVKSTKGAPGVILHYRVPLDELNALHGKLFPSPNEEWQDFVRAGRTYGGPPHDYDWIEGPLLFQGAQWLRGEVPLNAGKQQIAFYTREAFDLLARSLVDIHY